MDVLRRWGLLADSTIPYMACSAEMTDGKGLCSCYGYFPKPLFPFQIAVLFLSSVSNISSFIPTDFSHHR